LQIDHSLRRNSKVERKRASLIADGKLEIGKEYGDVTIQESSPGLLPTRTTQSGTRSVVMMVEKDSVRLIENVGQGVEKILDWQFLQISEVTWDHQHSAFRIVKLDTEEFVTLHVTNSSELEQDLGARINAVCEGEGVQAPAVTYVGIFAGTQKPKPFQRKRASLTKKTDEDSQLSPQDMRRLSLTTNSAREKGTRRGLAIEHIHTGERTTKRSRPPKHTNTHNHDPPRSNPHLPTYAHAHAYTDTHHAHYPLTEPRTPSRRERVRRHDHVDRPRCHGHFDGRPHLPVEAGGEHGVCHPRLRAAGRAQLGHGEGLRHLHFRAGRLQCVCVCVCILRCRAGRLLLVQC
jgi:hypothetical protein